MITDTNEFGYVYVLECTTSSIYEIKLDSITESMELDELLNIYGLSIDYCYTMYSEIKKEIETLKINQ